MQPESLSNIAGQLTAWQHVNAKCNDGIRFYLRDMSQPFETVELPFDSSSIHKCFEEQLFVLSKDRPAADNPILFREVDWQLVESAILSNLFGYLNDKTGHVLIDPTKAFSASSDGYQKAVAHSIAVQIKDLAQTDRVFRVDNNPEFFSGFVFLIDADKKFYELRLGHYF